MGFDRWSADVDSYHLVDNLILVVTHAFEIGGRFDFGWLNLSLGANRAAINVLAIRRGQFTHLDRSNVPLTTATSVCLDLNRFNFVVAAFNSCHKRVRNELPQAIRGVFVG